MLLWGNQSCDLCVLQKAEEDGGFQMVSFSILKNPESDVLLSPPFSLASALSELDLILLLPRIFF